MAIAATGFYIAGKYILPQIVGSTDLAAEIPQAVPGQSLLGRRAPNFALSDLAGDRTALSQYYGAPAIVTFWATWSADAADQVKILDDYARNDSEQARLVNVVAIDSQEDPSIVASFMERGGYGTKALLDPFGEASSRYDVKGLPTTYFISRDGAVKEIYAGILSERVLVEKVDNLLKQSTVQ